METNKILAKPERLMKKTKKELVDIIITNDQLFKEHETAIEAYKGKMAELKDAVTNSESRVENISKYLLDERKKLNNKINKYKIALTVVSVVLIAVIAAIVLN